MYETIKNNHENQSCFQAKLLAFEGLKSMAEPEVPLSSSESFGREVLNRRPDLEDYYSAQERRGSWDTPYERYTDDFITSPKDQLLDMIKLYNYLQSQRDSGEDIRRHQCKR